MADRQFRVDFELPIMVCFGGMELSARVTNISQQGAGIVSTEPLPRQSLVLVRSDRLPTLRAKDMWREGEQHGLIFQDTYIKAPDSGFSDGALTPP